MNLRPELQQSVIQCNLVSFRAKPQSDHLPEITVTSSNQEVSGTQPYDFSDNESTPGISEVTLGTDEDTGEATGKVALPPRAYRPELRSFSLDRRSCREVEDCEDPLLAKQGKLKLWFHESYQN